MDACTTRFLKKKDHMSNFVPEINHVIKEKKERNKKQKNKCEKVGDYKCKRWAWWESW